jgi:hypothetical protein
MSVATTSGDPDYVPVKKIERKVNSSSVARNQNYRSTRFLALYETLKSLPELPEDDIFHLSLEVCDRAVDFVGLIAANLTIDPPRFFPQDGEAAVFTWDDGTVKRLLTLDAEDIDILDVHKETFMKCPHNIPNDKEKRQTFILTELGRYAQSSSTYEYNE